MSSYTTHTLFTFTITNPPSSSRSSSPSSRRSSTSSTSSRTLSPSPAEPNTSYRATTITLIRNILKQAAGDKSLYAEINTCADGTVTADVKAGGDVERGGLLRIGDKEVQGALEGLRAQGLCAFGVKLGGVKD